MKESNMFSFTEVLKNHKLIHWLTTEVTAAFALKIFQQNSHFQ